MRTPNLAPLMLKCNLFSHQAHVWRSLPPLTSSTKCATCPLVCCQLPFDLGMHFGTSFCKRMGQINSFASPSGLVKPLCVSPCDWLGWHLKCIHILACFDSPDATNHGRPTPWPDNLAEKCSRRWTVDPSCDVVPLVIEQSKALDQVVWRYT